MNFHLRFKGDCLFFFDNNAMDFLLFFLAGRFSPRAMIILPTGRAHLEYRPVFMVVPRQAGHPNAYA